MKRALPLLGLFVASLVLAGCQGGDPVKVAQRKGKGKPAPLRVKIAKVKRQMFRLSTTQPGRIEAYEEAPLYSKISGYVKTVMVDIGDQVKKGDVLARLYVPEMEKDVLEKHAKVDQAVSEVEQAARQIEVAEKTATVAKAAVAEAEASIKRAQGTYNYWKSSYLRTQGLVKAGSVSETLLDEAVQQFTSADAALAEARAKERTVQAAFAKSASEVAKAKADQAAAITRKAVANAALESAQTLLQYLEIKAPFTGKVTRRKVDPGHFVGPSGKDSTPLFVVTRTDKVRIMIDVPEVESWRVDVGDPVSIKIPALPRVVLDSGNSQGMDGPRITRISWSLRPPTRTLRAEVEVDNRTLPKESKLRPGMYAIVSIIEDERPNALTVPLSAIVTGPKGDTVFIVEKGVAVVRPVTIALRNESEALIESGLNEGETVIISRLDAVRPGFPIISSPTSDKTKKENGEK
jgi:RND family efflux transporter MFP subunit